MSDAPTVKFDSVWKRLTRRAQVTTLAELLYAVPRRLMNPRRDGLREHEFWALQNLNFSLRPGESLGVVGPNGAGKSSLLKLLFRIFRPDRGHVQTRGRVTGLIELGAGFHPILNGRENVFINGAILGMRQKEIRAKYDAIVKFAELEDFMDMPVKNYSSGMAARLSFAIAAHADPDVLLVDEVLAVGDASFQVRCHEWIERTRKAGTTIVMVSHQMHVLQNADRVLYLDGGESKLLDEPGVAIGRYLADQAERIRESDAVRSTAEGITRVQLLQGDEPAHEIEAGAPATFRVHYSFEKPVTDPVVTLELVHSDPRFLISTPGAQLAQLSSGLSLRGHTALGSGCFDVEVGALQLPVGMYSVRAAVKAHGDFTASIRRDDALRFEIMRPAESDSTSLIDLPQNWRIVEPSEIPQP